jgi:hypothetical protein
LSIDLFLFLNLKIGNEGNRKRTSFIGILKTRKNGKIGRKHKYLRQT